MLASDQEKVLETQIQGIQEEVSAQLIELDFTPADVAQFHGVAQLFVVVFPIQRHVHVPALALSGHLPSLRAGIGDHNADGGDVWIELRHESYRAPYGSP